MVLFKLISLWIPEHYLGLQYHDRYFYRAYKHSNCVFAWSCDIVLRIAWTSWWDLVFIWLARLDPNSITSFCCGFLVQQAVQQIYNNQTNGDWVLTFRFSQRWATSHRLLSLRALKTSWTANINTLYRFLLFINILTYMFSLLFTGKSFNLTSLGKLGFQKVT